MASTSKTTKSAPLARRRTMTGKVLRKSGDKTVAVEIERVVVHPLYNKRTTRRKRYLVHDPLNAAIVGQVVTLAETRPMSRSKRWVIVPAK